MARARHFTPMLLLPGLLLSANAQAQAYSRTEIIGYSDNTAKWVLGQTASVTCTASLPISTACDGDVVSSTTFDATTALPVNISAFGKLQSAMTYNADGTLATLKDGLNNTISYSNWKRGIPQSITHADTTTQSAEVNDRGWIMAVTEENNYTTRYTYDAMGQLTSIAYPIGDTVPWTNTIRSFVPVAVAEYGIPAGHWRETVSTGNATKIIYYNTLWQPLLIREYDAANITATERFTKTAYDTAGRVAFVSYPLSNVSSAEEQYDDKGLTSFYDPLGRVTSLSQDSEIGLLTTTMEYLPGFQVRVTNPRQQVSTTSYMVYDEPHTNWPVLVNSPESSVTSFTRDAFGKALTMVRSGGGVTPQVRYYAYNSYQELCKSWEPETRGSIYAYDAAGNLTQSAAGLNAVTRDSTNCNADQFSAGRTVTRSYDARNRLRTLIFPDGNGDQTWTYTNDGLPSSVSTINGGNAVLNAYTYNKRRLLTGESMKPDTVQLGWGVGYGYNELGQVVSEAYPASVLVTYTVNAMGQTTQLSAASDGGAPTTIISGASYHPNGGLKQFTYGNGIVHAVTQNDRQLPSRSTDGTALDLGTTFDANGNVTAITDYTASARQTRSMIYDGLDRLTSATSPMFGTASYSYDALDNLKTVVAPGRNHTYNYNTNNNRLLSVTDTITGSSVIGMNYDLQGNLFNKNGVGFIFDYGNRLRTTAGLTYRYDADGRRVRQDAAGLNLKYAYYAKDGRLVWQRDETLSKRISNLYLAGSLVAEYSRPIGSQAVTVNYLHTDALGSPIAKTNSAGTVIETSEYEPFGKLLNRPNDDRAGYTGHVMDSASGMTYMQQRYFDPGIGRFLSVDPVTANSPTGRNFNRYWYAENNPYTFEDKDGREPTKKQAGTVPGFLKHMNQSPSKIGLTTGRGADKALQSLGTTSGMPPSPAVTPYFNNRSSRYIYTEKSGWIDMVHFLFYAGMARTFEAKGYTQDPIGEAVQRGFTQERFDVTRSKFSYEDLPSDKAGAMFGVKYFNPNSKLTLGQQIGKFLREVLGAKMPEDAPNYSELPEEDKLGDDPPTQTNYGTDKKI